MIRILLIFFGVFIGIIIGKKYTDFNWKKIDTVVIKTGNRILKNITRIYWKEKPNILKWKYKYNPRYDQHGNILFKYKESDASFRTRVKQKINSKK